MIAKIDSEGKAGAAGACAARRHLPAPAAGRRGTGRGSRTAKGGAKSDVAMPAAAKLLADNQLTTGDVAGTGKDGRVTKGDVLAAVEGGAKAKAPAPATAIPPRAEGFAAAGGGAVRRSPTWATARSSACR